MYTDYVFCGVGTEISSIYYELIISLGFVYCLIKGNEEL
jgi:hypothetical protein